MNIAAIISGSEVDITADGDAGLGDRWVWCANLALMHAQKEAVSVAASVRYEMEDALDEIERSDASSFDKARAETAYNEAYESWRTADSALERLEAELDDALAQTQAAALAANDEDAYSAADIAAEIVDPSAYWFSSHALRKRLADASETVLDNQHLMVRVAEALENVAPIGTQATHLAWSVVHFVEIGYMDEPIRAAWLVAAYAHRWASHYSRAVYNHEPDSSWSGTYWVEESAKAVEWAAAARDAVTVYYTAGDAGTRQDALGWADRIADEGLVESRNFAHFPPDLPPPPAPPQTVSDFLSRIEIEPPEQAIMALSQLTPSPWDLFYESVSGSAATAEDSSDRIQGLVFKYVRRWMLAELCKS